VVAPTFDPSIPLIPKYPSLPPGVLTPADGDRVKTTTPTTELEDVSCTSLPEPDSNKLFFGCSCRDRYGDAKFQTGQFISSVDPSVFDKNIIIIIRDCWSLRLTLDEDDLYKTESMHFRPDLFLSKLFLENIVEIHVNGSSPSLESSNGTSEYIRLSEAVPVSVTLYDVERVYLHDVLNTILIQTENSGTVLNIGETNLEESSVKIRGFKADNIMLAGTQIKTNQKAEFSHVLVSIAESITSKSMVLSLVLGACVCVVGLGVGAAIYATVKRHQYLIQAVVYSSFDSLRRPKKPVPDSPDDVTTTSVSFFPKYSIVMKQKKGPGKLVQVEDERPEAKPSKEAKSDKASLRSKLSKISDLSTVGRRYLSTETKTKTPKPEASGNPEERKGKEESKTSFYYRTQSDTSASSKSDLTTLRTPHRVEAQVHRSPSPTSSGASPKSRQGLVASSIRRSPTTPTPKDPSRPTRSSSGTPRPPQLPLKIGIYSSKYLETDKKRKDALGSPQPLIESERKYSFTEIREKCRKLISLNPLHSKL